MKCNITEKQANELVQKAMDARKYAYVPYSKFRVGAALLTTEGEIFTGCNIENAAYSPTNCAERTAFFKAVSEGKRVFLAIAIVGGENKTGEYCPPCGVCRQVMLEFCDIEKFCIILGNNPNDYQIYTLEEFVPFAFNKGNL